MGIVKENLLTKGFSGKIGDEIVFRQIDGTTRFAKRPRKRTTLTPNQAAKQEKFTAAVFYAKASLLNETTRAAYVELAKLANLKSAYTAAVLDYLSEPTIALVHTDAYKGDEGDVIFILGEEHFKLHQVEVTITLANGTVVESGAATRQENDWMYVATQANAAVAGSKIVVKAKDRIGKESTFEKVL